ncbi:DUF938 domain-containing protein [Hyphomicrobium nitrativorans]|nr:DUF938 domain-containing protein [Hyphomicrobium nitrativorans]
MPRETTVRLAGDRLVSPSAERNKAPISGILKDVLPREGFVLEIGSGTGQHIVHFAREMPSLAWQPSERDEPSLASIAHWMATADLSNVNPPLRLDVMEQPWPVSSAAAVVSLNMIHIAPWLAAEALIRGARDVLIPDGLLFLYGPFRRDGRHTADSNEAFDRSLRSRNPAWGVRDLEEVARTASVHGFGAPTIYEMPANNLSVVFRKV